MSAQKRFSSVLFSSAIALAFAMAAKPAQAQNTACAPAIGTVGTGAGPIMDGIIDVDGAFVVGSNNAPTTYNPAVVSDPGWNNAEILYLTAGGSPGTSASGILRLGTRGSVLWIGGTILNGFGASPDDTIMIGLANGSTTLGLVLNPVTATNAGWAGNVIICPNVTSQQIQFSTNLTTSPAIWTPLVIGGGTPTASWLTNATGCPPGGSAGFAYANGGQSWSFEMAIPLVAVGQNGMTSGFGGAGASTFQFYFNVVKTMVVGNGSGFEPSAQFYWPPTGSALSGTVNQSIEDIFPPVASWGTLNLGSGVAQCGGGISVTPGNIGTVDGAGHFVDSIVIPALPSGQTYSAPCGGYNNNWEPSITGQANTPNNFQATVQNSGGAAATVNVTFRLSNFGVPGPNDWGPINNPPTADTQPTPNSNPVQISLPAGTVGTPSSTNANTTWELSPLQACTLVTSASSVGFTHDCMEVELAEVGGSVPLISSSAQQNTWWQPASSATYKAIVSANGLGTGTHSFLLTILDETFPNQLDSLLPSQQQPPACSNVDPNQSSQLCCALARRSKSPLPPGCGATIDVATAPGAVVAPAPDAGASSAPTYSTMRAHAVGWLDTGKTVTIRGRVKHIFRPQGDYYEMTRHFITTAPSSPNQTIAVAWQTANTSNEQLVTVPGAATTTPTFSNGYQASFAAYTLALLNNGSATITTQVNAVDSVGNVIPPISCACDVPGGRDGVLGAFAALLAIASLALLAYRRSRKA
jgi:hypothetical protein